MTFKLKTFIIKKVKLKQLLRLFVFQNIEKYLIAQNTAIKTTKKKVGGISSFARPLVLLHPVQGRDFINPVIYERKYKHAPWSIDALKESIKLKLQLDSEIKASSLIS